MADYLILIYQDERPWEHADEAMYAEMYAAHEAFAAKHAAVLRGGHALTPSSTATSLRTDATGNVHVTDGAFAETKEALGGFYLIDVADLDAALAVARDVPMPTGGVEVRPIRVFD